MISANVSIYCLDRGIDDSVNNLILLLLLAKRFPLVPLFLSPVIRTTIIGFVKKYNLSIFQTTLSV